jgi:type IV secretion system protein TrbL
MIAVFGMGVMFDQGGRFKQALNIALGTAIAVNVGGGLLAFGFGDLLSPSLSAGSAVPIYHVNITNDLKNFDLMSGFMNNFIQICKHGGVTLGGYAFQLMGLLLMIEMSVALSLGLINENKIQYLFAQILKIGIFVWLINNWVSGTYGIAHAIVASFEHLGYLAAGATAAYTPDSIVQNSINTV